MPKLNLKSLCKGPTLEKDKGYAWVILLMSFLSHFLHMGFSLAILGNLTVAHKEYFNIDLQLASLIGSVHIGVCLIAGI